VAQKQSTLQVERARLPRQSVSQRLTRHRKEEPHKKYESHSFSTHPLDKLLAWRAPAALREDEKAVVDHGAYQCGGRVALVHGKRLSRQQEDVTRGRKLK
jgi:hypothetical protein